MRLGEYGEHTYDTKKKLHHIRISPKICSHGKSNTKWDVDQKEFSGNLVRMNRYDTVCRIIQVTLHELMHANQCDRDVRKYWKDAGSLHPKITQSFLRYELSPLEAEAEGRALLNFNSALERYERWCEE
jgi:hypothetical protein